MEYLGGLLNTISGAQNSLQILFECLPCHLKILFHLLEQSFFQFLAITGQVALFTQLLYSFVTFGPLELPLSEDTQYYGVLIIEIRFSGLNGCSDLANWKFSIFNLPEVC